MSLEQQRPPLWKEMREARACSTAPSGNWTVVDGFAAEIRAVRDWLVPDEEDAQPTIRVCYYLEECQSLSDLLIAEAERAELEAQQ